jgi:hypothetical protein
MVLFNDVVEVFALPQSCSPRQPAFLLQGLDGRHEGRILVYVDDPGHAIAGSAKSFTEEAFGSGSIAFRGEPEIDSSAVDPSPTNGVIVSLSRHTRT